MSARWIVSRRWQVRDACDYPSGQESLRNTAVRTFTLSLTGTKCSFFRAPERTLRGAITSLLSGFRGLRPWGAFSKKEHFRQLFIVTYPDALDEPIPAKSRISEALVTLKQEKKPIVTTILKTCRTIFRRLISSLRPVSLP